MRISLQSQVCLVTCVAVSAYNAYSNPVRWISFLAGGVLWGLYTGHSDRLATRDLQFDCNVESDDAKKQQDFKQNAVSSLTNSMPGPVATATNLLALGFISQIVNLPSGWDPRLETSLCDTAAIAFGWHVGMLIQLSYLAKDKNSAIQHILARTII